MNKNTKQDFEVQIRLDSFVPQATYTKAVLNSANPGGHDDIFKINPWRLSTKGKCVPENGGCSPTLASEAHENIVLRTSSNQDARELFSITIPAHSATLLKLTRAADSDGSLSKGSSSQ